MSEEKSELDLEWERRTLCSDGSCIGVIGPDGNCRECGKPYEGELPEMDAFGEADSDSDETREAGAPEARDEDSGEAQELDEEWESRRLCSDGSCIGVIGPDGNCKECGKPFEG